jgi:hypothetical protein
MYSNDSNKLKIGFSPQFNIDDDIQQQFGSFELDTYIDSNDSGYKYYSGLAELAEFYSKTQLDENPIMKYLRTIQIYDFTVFQQIQQLIPARTNTILGLIIENSILQRVRIKQTPDISVSTDSRRTGVVNINAKKRQLSLNEISGVITGSKNIVVENIDDIPMELSVNSKTIANFNVIKSKIDVKDIHGVPYGVYNRTTGSVNTKQEINRVFSRYLKYPSSIIPFTTAFSGSFNSAYNYTVPADTDSNIRIIQDVIGAQENIDPPVQISNLDFYKKIIYFYETPQEYENQIFYSSSTAITSDGTYPYRKSRGFQNSTFVGTKNSALAVNQISTQPSLANYSPVFEITGSQLQPTFTYEFIESSGSGVIYDVSSPFVPKPSS